MKKLNPWHFVLLLVLSPYFPVVASRTGTNYFRGRGNFAISNDGTLPTISGEAGQVRRTKDIRETDAPTSTPTGAPKAAKEDDQKGASSPSPFPVTSTSPPTKSPTSFPTTVPTARPTIFPTSVPTAAPTGSPTRTATGVPTTTPTVLSTQQRTLDPTARTLDPTAIPTGLPTVDPTTMPTIHPSSVPSVVPTNSPPSARPVAPTIIPIQGGAPFRDDVRYETNYPTVTASDSPTEQSVVEVNSTFTIVVANGIKENITFSVYETDLAIGLQMLSAQIVQDLFRSEGKALRRRLGVRLAASPSFHSVLDVGFTDSPMLNEDGSFRGGACPLESGDPEFDRCESITATLTLSVGGSEEHKVQTAFEEALTAQILSGELQVVLNEIDEDTVVTVLLGKNMASTETPTIVGTENLGEDDQSHDKPSKDIFSIPVISGIAVGGIALLGLLVLIPSKKKTIPKSIGGVIDKPPVPREPTNMARRPLPKDGRKVLRNTGHENMSLSLPSYLMNENLGVISEADTKDEQSSVGTLESDFMMMGANIVDFGGEGRGLLDDRMLSNEKLDELEAAIMNGDWAALGAVAKVLASDSNYDNASASLASSRGTWQGFLDVSKASELNLLIEHGNWEGVMDAALRYQAEKEPEDTDDDSVVKMTNEPDLSAQFKDGEDAAGSQMGTDTMATDNETVDKSISTPDLSEHHKVVTDPEAKDQPGRHIEDADKESDDTTGSTPDLSEHDHLEEDLDTETDDKTDSTTVSSERGHFKGVMDRVAKCPAGNGSTETDNDTDDRTDSTPDLSEHESTEEEMESSTKNKARKYNEEYGNETDDSSDGKLDLIEHGNWEGIQGSPARNSVQKDTRDTDDETDDKTESEAGSETNLSFSSRLCEF